MKLENNSNRTGEGLKSLPVRLGLVTLLAGAGLAFFVPAHAAAPLGGSVIANQASATYKDGSGLDRTSTSNLVETTVEKVGALTLVNDNTKTAALGNTVYMPHTLTNTGNFADSFTLSMTNNTPGANPFDFASIAIYADANSDGIPDSTTPLCTFPGTCPAISLPAGGSYSFVTALAVPSVGPASGDTDNVTITATAGTPAQYTTPAVTNTDTVNITDQASFQVTKSISDTGGLASATETVTYTLTYKNIGGAAGNITVRDVINSVANNTNGFTYVAGSARWGNNALVALTDATEAGNAAEYGAINGSEIRYGFAANTINATITNVQPNVVGQITFEVQVKATAAIGTSTTTNTAEFSTDTNNDPTDNPGTLPNKSNPSPYEVLSTYSVVLNDDGATNVDGNNTAPATAVLTDSPNLRDLVYVATASAGQSITFTNTVWNTGNGTDTFNITYNPLTTFGTWPAGTTFDLLKPGGAVQLIDTNNDGIPDTGPIGAGESYELVIRINLPANAAASTAGQAFDVAVTATSVGDNTVSNVTYDRLGAITIPTVDLANSTITYAVANADVIGAAPTTTITLPTTYNGPVAFDLYVANEAATGTPKDTYALQYSNTNFANNVMTAGWSVQFRTAVGANCSKGAPNNEPVAGGTPIVSLQVAPQSQVHFCAIVTPPAGSIAATEEVYFQVESATTGATDTKWDRVIVGPNNKLEILPSNTGQLFPGGTVVYPHTVKNSGTTSCTNILDFNIDTPTAGWSYTLYRDVNSDGLIDAGDTIIDPNVDYALGGALNPFDAGEQFKILVKVFAPAGASGGAIDTATINVIGNCNGGTDNTTSNDANDKTTVVTGDVRLYKTQAINSGCTAIAPASFVTTPLTAKPGECIWYRVVATNEGLTDITNLVISDTTPSFTGYDLAPNCVNGVASTQPGTPTKWTATTNGTQNVNEMCTVGTLAPGESATLRMTVQVNKF